MLVDIGLAVAGVGLIELLWCDGIALTMMLESTFFMKEGGSGCHQLGLVGCCICVEEGK